MPSDFDGRDVEGLSADGEVESSSSEPARVRLPETPRFDQGDEVDCCTSCAIATAMELVDRRDGASCRLSPLFHYYFARTDRRSLGALRLRTALRAAVTRGLCRLELHAPTFDIEGALSTPSRQAIADARQQRLLAFDANRGRAGYFAVHSGDRVRRFRALLKRGQPIIIGFWTQASYWRGEGMQESEAARHEGAHAAVVVGFDDDRKVFRVRDSRGGGFAEQGEWNLSYQVANSGRIAESWTLESLTYDTRHET